MPKTKLKTKTISNRPAQRRLRVQRMVSPQPDTVGRLAQAKRHALHHFDEWNSVTVVPPPHTGYYYEIASLIEDAVEFGYGVAHGKTFKQIKRRINAG